MNKKFNKNEYGSEFFEIFSRVNKLEKKISKIHPVVKMLAGIPDKPGIAPNQESLKPMAFFRNLNMQKKEEILSGRFPIFTKKD